MDTAIATLIRLRTISGSLKDFLFNHKDVNKLLCRFIIGPTKGAINTYIKTHVIVSAAVFPIYPDRAGSAT